MTCLCFDLGCTARSLVSRRCNCWWQADKLILDVFTERKKIIYIHIFIVPGGHTSFSATLPTLQLMKDYTNTRWKYESSRSCFECLFIRSGYDCVFIYMCVCKLLQFSTAESINSYNNHPGEISHGFQWKERSNRWGCYLSYCRFLFNFLVWLCFGFLDCWHWVWLSLCPEDLPFS